MSAWMSLPFARKTVCETDIPVSPACAEMPPPKSSAQHKTIPINARRTRVKFIRRKFAGDARGGCTDLKGYAFVA